MPVIGAVTSSWAKLSENGLFNGVLTCFIQVFFLIILIKNKNNFRLAQLLQCHYLEYYVQQVYVGQPSFIFMEFLQFY